MSSHPSELRLSDLRDDLINGAQCLSDPVLHMGPDPVTTIEHPDARAAREQVAREVCQSCPVAATCLAYAIETRPTRGIWAGLAADQVTALADLHTTVLIGGMPRTGKSFARSAVRTVDVAADEEEVA